MSEPGTGYPLVDYRGRLNVTLTRTEFYLVSHLNSPADASIAWRADLFEASADGVAAAAAGAVAADNVLRTYRTVSCDGWKQLRSVEGQLTNPLNMRSPVHVRWLHPGMPLR